MDVGGPHDSSDGIAETMSTSDTGAMFAVLYEFRWAHLEDWNILSGGLVGCQDFSRLRFEA